MENKKYLKFKKKETDDYFLKMTKKAFGLKGIILGILTFGTYQIRLARETLVKTGLQ
jgi:hypothetical protein